MAHNLATSIYFRSPAWIQNVLVSLYGYSLYRKRYTGIYSEIQKKINSTKKLNPAQINSMQEEMLNSMVNYCAKNIEYYKRLFSEISLSPNQITSISDLKKIPVLEKKTLIKNISQFKSTNTARSFMIQRTSGSTGTPLELAVNEYTYKLAMALLVDHEESHGVPFGARRATFAGRMVQPINIKKPPFSRFNAAENQRIFSSYHLNEKTFPQYKKELDIYQPQEIIGYPSAIGDLANYYLESGERPKFQLTAIITNSETLLAWQREAIENVFGCTVFDYYGTAEYLIFAGQDKNGIYHTNPIIGISEIINNNENINKGNIIASTLVNTSMPLLRYDIGDIGQIEKENSECPGVLALSQIEGRKDDYIQTIDNRKIGRIDHIFKGMKGIREAQVIQISKNKCLIQIVKIEHQKIDERLLLENFHERLGDSMIAEIVYKKEIPRGANGKFKSVVGLTN